VISTEQYAASIVEKYHVQADTESPSHRAADEIIPVVKDWGKQYLQGLTLTGAYAKNTAVSVSSHVDVLVSLSPVPGREIKNVFWNLFEYLSDHDRRPRTREVSIQVAAHGLKVDLIPAYRERNGNILFNKKSGAAVHTDLARHVHLVANSGRQQEICAFKIWRERNSLEFPSLYLEMIVLKALEAERFGQLAENVLAVLRFIANRMEHVTVCDPANGDNILSNDLTAKEKADIAKAARDALYDENWKKILW